jgi:hypothetical protein
MSARIRLLNFWLGQDVDSVVDGLWEDGFVAAHTLICTFGCFPLPQLYGSHCTACADSFVGLYQHTLGGTSSAMYAPTAIRNSSFRRSEPCFLQLSPFETSLLVARHSAAGAGVPFLYPPMALASSAMPWYLSRSMLGVPGAPF